MTFTYVFTECNIAIVVMNNLGWLDVVAVAQQFSTVSRKMREDAGELSPKRDCGDNRGSSEGIVPISRNENDIKMITMHAIDGFFLIF